MRTRGGLPGIRPGDVRKALVTATRCSSSRDAWKVAGGVDLDGDELTVVCVLAGDVLVITLM